MPIAEALPAAHGATAPWKLLGLPMKVAFMAAAVLAVGARAHGQNLVLNGSFESPAIPNNSYRWLPTIPGWSTPNVGGQLELWNHYGSIPSTDGDQHLEINANLVDQTVLQSVSVIPGALTTFSFDYTGRQFTDNTFTVTVTGNVSNTSYVNTTLNPVTHYLSHAWHTFSTAFTPDLMDSTLTIAFRGHPIRPVAGAARIDNVSLCCGTVVDTTPPVLTCAPDKAVECGSAWNFDEPTVTSGSCDVGSVTLSVLETVTTGTCPQTSTRTWQVTDGCGNSATCSQTVTVVPPPDADGDGIPDITDHCPNSNNSPTVVIDGCNTGVPNILSPDGCTISDLIFQCAATANSHGQFVSCVATLTNALKAQGVITGQQKGAIQRCAAQSSLGH